MRNLFLALMALVLLAGCSAVGGKPKETWQSSFKSVPLEERVGGQWTGGPPSR